MKITFNSKWRINANEATPALNEKESKKFITNMVKEEKKKCSSIDKKMTLDIVELNHILYLLEDELHRGEYWGNKEQHRKRNLRITDKLQKCREECNSFDKKIFDDLDLQMRGWKEHFDRTGELLCLTCNKPMKPYKGEEYSWFCPDCSPHIVLNLLREMQKTVEKDVKKIVKKQKVVLEALK